MARTTDLPKEKMLAVYWLNYELTNTFACPSPRNILCFKLKDGTPQVNVVNLVGASFNGTPDNFDPPYFQFEPSLLNVLNNADVQALQAAGIKVVLTVMGNGREPNGIGWSSIPENKNKDFSEWVNKTILSKNGYGLDGIDIDDEYAKAPGSNNQLIATVKSMDSIFPSEKIISKAFWQDLNVIADIKDYLTYGSTMCYGWETAEIENNVDEYIKKGLTKDQVCAGVQAGPPESDWMTSLQTTVELSRWTVEKKTKGMMIWSFSQDIQQFTSYPQHERPYPSPDDHQWMKAIIENMWGKDNWVVKKSCIHGLYVPDGSYMDSSRDIKVELSGKAKNRQGQEQMSAINVTDFNNADIVNDDGKLTKTDTIADVSFQEKMKQLRIKKGLGRYAPEGSYLESTNNVKLTLSAQCRTIKGKYVSSSLDISQYQGDGKTAISNLDGQLTLEKI